MSNTLTKAAAARKVNVNDPSLIAALKNGGPIVWLSCLIMGLANIANGQIIMGLLYIAVEVGVIVFLTTRGGGI